MRFSTSSADIFRAIKPVRREGVGVLLGRPVVPAQGVRPAREERSWFTLRDGTVGLVNKPDLIVGAQGSSLSCTNDGFGIVQPRVVQQALRHPKYLLQSGSEARAYLPRQLVGHPSTPNLHDSKRRQVGRWVLLTVTEPAGSHRRYYSSVCHLLPGDGRERRLRLR